MFRQIGSTVFLVFCILAIAGTNIAAGQSPVAAAEHDQTASFSIAPPRIAPGKDLFVAREGDPFIITAAATCLLEDDSDTQFEVLEPAPSFIHVSEAYRRDNKADGYSEAIGVVYVTPEIGDAGKYVVNLQVKACSGKVERVITFRVHVKAARLD